MTTQERLHILRHTLDSFSPPESITQRDFEAGPEHLDRLAALSSDERADIWDLYDYAGDLQFTEETQVSLFRYLLPFCLGAWNEYLQSERFECPGFAESFYTALVKKRLLDECLTEVQRGAVLAFMRESILEEIDSQRGLYFSGYPSPPYRWIQATMTYGVVAADIEKLWTEWWSVNTDGRAVAVVQFVSCLLYPKTQNPVFAPYSRDKGGGPPCLWQFDGYLYQDHWQQSNVEFLQRFLDNRNNVVAALSRSVERLVDSPEYATAQKILSDIPSRSMTLERRCASLPSILSKFYESFDWPD